LGFLVDFLGNFGVGVKAILRITYSNQNNRLRPVSGIAERVF
jgi:hypothetical protein